MRKKIGRNDPCWCGSGKKYKHCHLNRVPNEPPKRWELDKELRKNFSRKVCLAPDLLVPKCSGGIVKAHTVPKSGSLKQIARDGHVYGFIPSLEAIAKSPGGRLYPELIGINEASTFSGFCKVHDNFIFSELEDSNFTATQKQCFLLAYRSLAMEIYRKESQYASLSSTDKIIRDTSSLQNQYDIQIMNHLLMTGSSAALKDNIHYKSIYDRILLSGDFSNIRAYIIEFESAPPIMCSCSIYPHKDFNGSKLQDIANLSKPPELLSCTSYYGGTCGLIVFTWLSDNDDTCNQFISSLMALPPDRITDGLIRFLFSYCENLLIQPDWWEHLETKKKEALVNRLYIAASVDLKYVDEVGNISDDGISYDNWLISAVRNIGPKLNQ